MEICLFFEGGGHHLHTGLIERDSQEDFELIRVDYLRYHVGTMDLSVFVREEKGELAGEIRVLHDPIRIVLCGRILDCVKFYYAFL